MQPSRALLYTIATIALAGCSQGTGMTRMSSYVPQSAVSSQQLSDRFNGNDVALESGGKPVPVVIGGSNLGGNRMTITQNAIQDLQHGNWGAPVNFAPASGQTLAMAQNGDDSNSTLSPYSIVMMVNGPSDITAANLCANPALADTAASTSYTPTNVRLVSALCRYDQEISDSTGVAHINGPNDPALHNLISSAAVDLTGPSTVSTQHNESL
jgi:hypothetical protein